MRTKPNILLIQDDQHNAGCLGVAGHPVIKTPNLDKLARGGIRLSNAFAASAICLPSRMSLMTGQYVHGHGFYGNRAQVPGDVVSWVQILRRNGYQTAAVGKMHTGEWRDDGFEYKRLCDPTDTGRTKGRADYYRYLKRHSLLKGWREQGLGKKKFMAGDSAVPAKHSLENWTVDRAIEYLGKRDKKKPFCLWVSFERPHAPHTVPKDVKLRYRPEQVPDPDLTHPLLHDRRYARPGVEDIWNAKRNTIKAYKQGVADYWSLITHIDDNIGRLMKELKRLGLDRNTLTIFNADHGDFGGTKGSLGKNVFTFDCLYRIPFIVHCPKWFKPGAYGGLFENIDFFPTLMGLLGLQIPPSCQGRDWSKQLRRGTFKGKEAVFYELLHVKTVRTKDYKLSYHYKFPGWSELFDLKKDPDERKNLFDDKRYQKKRVELLERLLRWHVETDRPRSVSRGWKLKVENRWVETCLEDKDGLCPERAK